MADIQDKKEKFDLKRVGARSWRFKTNGVFHTIKAGKPITELKIINSGKEVEAKKEYILNKIVGKLPKVALDAWFISKAEFEKRKDEEEAAIEANKKAIKKAEKDATK